MSDRSELLVEVIRQWVADPDSAVVYAEEVEGRWAVRMTHTVRDATTVWWEAGERTVKMEAYVGPVPDHAAAQVYRLALIRNREAWRCHFALDKEDGLVLRGRIANEDLDAEALDALLGECYDLIERTFPLLVGFYRGRPRT
ncbi:MAG: type III secretion system chaperone [Acidimicrobiia bacterium]|nr:type III secretion system chaperone [Acidimicrobiia bacterium]